MMRIALGIAVVSTLTLTSFEAAAAPARVVVTIPAPHAAVPVGQPVYRAPTPPPPPRYQPPVKRVESPERKQAFLRSRIEAGARSGALSRNEVRSLTRELERIDRQIRFARNDRRGLDARELASIERAQKKLAEKIRREMQPRRAYR